jgi:DNA-binding CsgD family transcriptional regulator/pimeloyl-ACP methyl ester carboxylesterase
VTKPKQQEHYQAKSADLTNWIYGIIGEPELWQKKTVDQLTKLLDQYKSLETDGSMLEFELGKQILDRLQGTNELVNALEMFLQNSRLGIIIIDEQYQIISSNSIAQSLANHITEPETSSVNGSVQKLLGSQADTSTSILDVSDQFKALGDERIYLHISSSKKFDLSASERIYKLLILPKNEGVIKLSPEIAKQYELTHKEAEILEMVVQGANTKEISAAKFVSLNTVKSHIKSLYHKTNTHSQAELINLVLSDEIEKLNSFLNIQYPVEKSRLSQTPTEFIKIAGSKELAYCDYGSKDGRPLVVLHNNYASRLNVPHDYAKYCEQHNRRVIIPDRPGYGQTLSDEDYPSNWNSYLHELVTQLQLEEYDLLANCLAAPLAFDYYRDKKVINKPQRIILTSPIFLSQSNHINYLDNVLIACARLIGHSPSIAREAFQLWLRSMAIDINVNPIHDVDNSLGEQEQRYREDNEFKQTIVHNFQQCTHQNGTGSAADLINCLTLKDDYLSKIDIPVDLWIGDRDELVSVEGVKKMFASLPNANINIKEGYSKHIYYTLFGDIIS